MRIWTQNGNNVSFQPESYAELEALDALLGAPFPGKSVAICSRDISEDSDRSVEQGVAVSGRISGHETQRWITIKQPPLYLMKINGQLKFLSLEKAGAKFNSDYDRVDTGEYVLLEDNFVRPMTDDDRQQISDIADRISANK